MQVSEAAAPGLDLQGAAGRVAFAQAASQRESHVSQQPPLPEPGLQALQGQVQALPRQCTGFEAHRCVLQLQPIRHQRGGKIGRVAGLHDPFQRGYFEQVAGFHKRVSGSVAQEQRGI